MPINKWILIAFVTLAVIGFADAAFLTVQHVQGLIPPCTNDGGCNEVLTSAYAEVVGVPVAAFGAFYYALLIVLMVAYLDTWKREILHWASWITTVGLLSSLYLIGVQVFAIGSFCVYCLVSAGASISLFALGVVIMRRD